MLKKLTRIPGFREAKLKPKAKENDSPAKQIERISSEILDFLKQPCSTTMADHASFQIGKRGNDMTTFRYTDPNSDLDLTLDLMKGPHPTKENVVTSNLVIQHAHNERLGSRYKLTDINPKDDISDQINTWGIEQDIKNAIAAFKRQQHIGLHAPDQAIAA